MPHIEFKPEIFNTWIIPYLHSTYRYNVFWGGRNSSKSYGTAQILLTKCLGLPYFRCLLTKDTYTSIKGSQFTELKDLITDYGLDHLFQFIESDPVEIRCIKNGNRFLARGCDKPKRLKSLKDITHVWYEEANQLTYDDFITITLTCRGGQKATEVQEYLTFNPEFEGEASEHWIWKMFSPLARRRHEGIIEVEHNGEKYSYNHVCHHTTFKDNRFIRPEDIAIMRKLEATDPYYADVFIKGIPGLKKVVNPFAHQYDPEKHEAPVQMQKSKEIFLTIDWNLNPFGFIFSHIWRDKDGWHRHQFDEESIEDGNVHLGIARIKLKYQKLLPLFQVAGDYGGNKREFSQSDNASLFEIVRRGLGLRKAQMNMVPNPKHSKSRPDVNYVLFHFDDWKVNPDTCPNTCRDMRSVVCDATGSIIKKDRKKITQRADHLDCVRYETNTYLLKWIDKNMREVY